MNRKIAVLDLDDTLADMNGLATQCLNYYTHRDLCREDFMTFNMEGPYAISHAEFYKYLEKDGVIDELAMLPGVRESMIRLHQDHRIIIVTARSHFRDALSRTMTWLNKKSLPFDQVHISGGHKGLKSDVISEAISVQGVDLFVDDGVHNVWDVYDSRLAEMVYVPRQPWNSRLKPKQGDAIYRVPSFRDAIGIYYADHIEGR